MIVYQTKSLTGLRERNEDELDIIVNYDGSKSDIKPLNFYAIYDGHGSNSVSKYVKERLSCYYMDKEAPINLKFNSVTCDKKICKSYDHLQKRLEKSAIMSRDGGSTALVIVQYPKGDLYCYLKIINLGDCRAVLCTHENIAIPLTKDHKPMAYDEYKRITSLKGVITQDKGDDPRINGFSVSRAFGDESAKPHITHIPEIFDYELTNKKGKILDKFIIMACDGVWDVLTNQEAVDFVLYKMDEISKLETCNTGKNNIALALGKHAIDKGSQDNISISIIFLL